jgi:hypothetical protein
VWLLCFDLTLQITTASGRLASSVYPMDTRDCCTAVILTLLAFAVGKFWGRLMLGWTVLTYALRNIYSLTEEAYEITIVMVAIAYASFLLLKKHLI